MGHTGGGIQELSVLTFVLPPPILTTTYRSSGWLKWLACANHFFCLSNVRKAYFCMTCYMTTTAKVLCLWPLHYWMVNMNVFRPSILLMFINLNICFWELFTISINLRRCKNVCAWKHRSLFSCNYKKILFCFNLIQLHQNKLSQAPLASSHRGFFMPNPIPKGAPLAISVMEAFFIPLKSNRIGAHPSRRLQSCLRWSVQMLLRRLSGPGPYSCVEQSYIIQATQPCSNIKGCYCSKLQIGMPFANIRFHVSKRLFTTKSGILYVTPYI
jgi:hypothetical protein